MRPNQKDEMNNTILAENESSRLTDLLSYCIINTPPDQSFDDITRLAAEICQVPISLISLVESHREWFKSHHGLGIEELPREYAFCSHAIMEPDEIMIVEDSRVDDRFYDNPIVTGEPFVIFYTGVPLITPAGHALGTLCVIDHQPRVLSLKQLEGLKMLANQVVVLLELHKKNTKLEQTRRKQLEERNRELEKINDELIQANIELELLTHVTMHDLKEPLNTILNFIELLKRKKEDILDSESLIFIDYIQQAGNRQATLIEKLLGYFKLGKQHVFEAVDTREIVAKVCKELSHHIQQKNIDIQIGELPIIWGLIVELSSLFQNLLSNAMKYTQPDTQSEITINCKELDDWYEFSVTDNGIGFDMAYREKIFLIFQRLHTDRKIPGTGIGLAQCKKIVQLHKGEIWADSIVGSGTTFSFTLPKNYDEKNQSYRLH